MKLNLQFFGEEDFTESVETPEVAEQVEIEESGETAAVEEAEQGAATPERDFDRDAIYASARRKAEKEANERVNAEFVRRFGNYKNPVTGAPITSMNEYFDALDSQNLQSVKERITSAGIDENTLNEYVENLPAIRRANELIKAQELHEMEERVNKDVAALHELDNSINTVADIPTEVLDLVRTGGANNIVDAYKIVNYGKWTTEKANSARQAAINQAKGKMHLAPVNGVSVMNEEVEIPDSQRAMWEAMFPDKSKAELRKLYNKQL